MNRSIKLSIILTISALSLFAQKPEVVLFSIGDANVTVDEFEYIYQKNNSINKSDDLYSEKSISEYLQLYINFKLKVAEAKSRGLDTSEQFIKEFTTYRNQLAAPYLNDKKVTESLIDEGYERMKWQISARHILIEVKEDAFPSEAEAAYEKAMKAKKEILSGKDFAEVARKYSNDPSVVQNNGELGLFTAFNMVYPFEEACYNAKLNEIVGPIRTQFGYHLIEVTSKQPYQGMMTAAHILLRTDETSADDVKEVARKKIFELYARLNNGEPFDKLAMTESEHASSAANGGVLSPFSPFETRIPKVMVEKAFQLTKDGDYSEPFQTQFGWHIVKRIKVEPLKSKTEMYEVIRRNVERDTRSHLSRESAIARIKKENRFKSYCKNLVLFKRPVDSALLSGQWQKDAKMTYSSPLFRIAKVNYTQADFAAYLLKTQMPDKFKNLNYAVDYYFEKFTEQSILDYEDKNLENKYRDFRNIVKEYREGILMFEVTQEEVWSKAMKDTTGLRAFFDKNKQNYMWKERADAIIFYCKNEQIANSIKNQLAEDNLNLEVLYVKMNETDASSFSKTTGVFEKGKEEVLDQVEWTPGFHVVKDYKGKYVLIKINKTIPVMPKQIKEIKGIVIADYQDYLDKQWIENLKAKYPVVVNQDAVKNLFK